MAMMVDVHRYSIQHHLAPPGAQPAELCCSTHDIISCQREASCLLLSRRMRGGESTSGVAAGGQYWLSEGRMNFQLTQGKERVMSDMLHATRRANHISGLRSGVWEL